MPITFSAANTTVTGYTPAQTTTILSTMQAAYNGSASARTMFDNWINAGKKISIANVPNQFSAFANTGNVQADLSLLNNATYIDLTGTAVQDTLTTALVHELGHALTGKLDNFTNTDYKGDNVKLVNQMYKELGIPEQVSYIAYDSSGTFHRLNYKYTNGATIDSAVTVETQGTTNWNSSPLGTSKDLLLGGASANILQSGAGDDFLFGGGGDDELRGDAGRDTAVYYGSELDYDIRQNVDGSWAVRNVRGAKDAGSDTLKNIEVVQFDGGKTYELKKKGLTFQTDFALVIDTTGSMGSSIDSVKTQASALIDAVFAGGKNDGRIGVVGFKDTTNGEPSSVILPFTDQDDFAVRKSTAISAINSITVGGGGDLPETAFDGLRLALNGSMGKWRPGSGVHRIALFTDAAAKDGALAAEVTALATSIGATISKKSSVASLGGSVDTFSLAFDGASPSVAARGGLGDPNANPSFPIVLTDEPIDPDPTTAQVQIFTILTGSRDPDTTALSDIAKANGGDLLTAPNNDELVKKLLEIIEAPPLPTISITANDPNAGETTNPGQFTITRTGDLTKSLTVNYTLSGTANNSADYQTLPGTIVFAAGAGTANINVNVIDDTINEGNETVILTLDNGGTKYQLDSVKSSGTVTIVDNDNISNTGLKLTGTPGPDTLTGGNGNDTISGLAGDDDLYGGAGNDSITGGEGQNYIEGGAGDDTISGGSGNDEFYGGSGDDELYGGAGDDWLDGGEGQNYIEGGAGDDTIYGGSGNDEFYGDAGNDSIDGGAGDDWLDGGADNDTLVGGAGEDTLVGGLGLDNLSGGAGVDVFVLNKNGGIDSIGDFMTSGDKLQVSASTFGGGLVAGLLSGNQFLSGAAVGAGSATNASQRFLYNNTTGALYFDANGSAAGNGVQIATLTTNPGLGNGDFSIVS
jgi:Ca2+-binding RTX toxin-like protein